MTPPRRLLGRPVRAQHLDAAPLPGYLCELCQDAPAVQWQPASEGVKEGSVGRAPRGTRRRAPGVCPMARLTLSDAARVAGVACHGSMLLTISNKYKILNI